MSAIVYWSFFSVLFGAFMAYPLFMLVSPLNNMKDASFTAIYSIATAIMGTAFFMNMIAPHFVFATTRQLYIIYLAMMGGLFLKSIWQMAASAKARA